MPDKPYFHELPPQQRAIEGTRVRTTCFTLISTPIFDPRELYERPPWCGWEGALRPGFFAGCRFLLEGEVRAKTDCYDCKYKIGEGEAT